MSSFPPPPPVGEVPPATDGEPARPRTRAERQRETRAALVEAALVVFSRDGYHGANLEAIANHAGFSKGAVYSNFDGKAELFLAVMDRNLAALSDGAWDPFEPLVPPAIPPLRTDGEGVDDLAAVMRGLGLATLEFIAIAARDEVLAPALTQRVQLLLDAYTTMAASSPADGEPLPPDEVATLLAALDQGFAVLALSGVVAADAALLRTGLRRLLDPVRAAEAGPVSDDGGPQGLHDREVQRRLMGGAPG